MRLDTTDESDATVSHLLDCSEAVDGTKVLVTNSPHLIGHAGTETHEWCGHTSDVVDNEHARMDTLLLDREELDQEVVLGVYSRVEQRDHQCYGSRPEADHGRRSRSVH